jgi:protocatechuate 3,4-dioxygenase beta subunit
VDVTLAQKKQVGVLAGHVMDLAQEPIENAFVRILEGPENPGEVRTDEDGEFVFEALRAGTYRIEVAANGFRTEQRPNVNVSPRRTTRLTFTLLR